MNEQSAINKKAWEYRAYEFWMKNEGAPEERAKIIMENPMARLKRDGKFFKNVEGLRIANPCGSNGRRAVALALLGAEVTVFDISKENKRYAMELADCAKLNLDYIVGDIYDIDMGKYEECFDMLYLEGGILHYFHDLHKFMKLLSSMLKTGGEIVLSDFHPFRKVMAIDFFKTTIGDYFDSSIHSGDVAYKDFLDKTDEEEFPECSLRLYNISDILNSLINAGFIIKEFNEHPSWTNEKLPGEFTVFAVKNKS